jgi:hypothetical protein
MALRLSRRRSVSKQPQLRMLRMESLERREVLANWYAAVNGLPTNDGTIGAPWDLPTALVNTRDIVGGDTLYLREGTYYHPNRSGWTSGYDIGLQGRPGQPVTVRPYANERVTIDGGMESVETPRHLIIRDLEILVSENLSQSRLTANPGSDAYKNELNRPWGGINLRLGHDIKVVNNVIHANAQGIGFWGKVSGNSELYGNIIYDNGWEGPDRNHGHGIYAQNATDDFKIVEDNILLGNWSLNMQAYGSTAARVDRFVVSRNVFAKTGASDSGQLLLGGQYPSQTIRVHDNVGYMANLSIGYVNKGDDAIVTGNRVKGDISFKQWTNLKATDNIEWYWGENSPRLDETCIPVPGAPYIIVNVNRYDSARANLVIWNFPLANDVTVDFSDFLNPGEAFKLLEPTDFYGAPVYEGVYQGKPVDVPIQGQEFATFVVMRGAPVAPPSTFAISAANAVQAEGDSGSTSFTFIVTRTGDSSQPATVDFAVSGTGANPATAADFASGTLPRGRIGFTAGQTSRSLLVSVVGDQVAEADETFAVRVFNPTVGASLGTAMARGTIRNDDTPPVGRPSLVGTAQQASVLITATNVTSGNIYTTMTDRQGNYTLEVPAGTYVATAYRPSMRGPVVATNLVVGDGPLTVDFDLARSLSALAHQVGRTDTGQWWVS